jgi:choline dehydrogenase-like flavoprotein
MPRRSPKQSSASTFDAVIVGAGASAVHAALPLARAGWHIAIVHPATESEEEPAVVPKSDFLTLRRTDAQQHEYFLGDDFSGVPFGPVRAGAQLTPTRARVARDLGPLSAIRSPGFSAVQSFVAGGLGQAWGASVMPWTDDDMHGWPVTRADLQPHYEAVAREIGVCGPKKDDLTEWLGPAVPHLPPAKPDSNGEFLLRRARADRSRLHEFGLRVGHPRLAVATKPHNDRGPLQYRDLEFWSDPDRAVYRPRFTLEELRAFPNVQIMGGLIAQSVQRTEGHLEVHCLTVDGHSSRSLHARKVILAAGTLNTTRVVLRSLDRYGVDVPLLSNPYTYFPCLLLSRIGAPSRDRRHSLTQVTMLFDPDGTRRAIVQPQAYSYRSLMLHRILKEAPLPHREAIRLMRLFYEYFMIIGVFHPDTPAPSKRLRLLRGDAPRFDILDIRYKPAGGELDARRVIERRLTRLFRSLGAWPLKRILPGEGASIHYAGTLPMSEERGDLTTSREGELHALPGVFVADGSVFPTLPAKGLTFTLMANAHRVATGLLRSTQP